jgi:hypothetical protein
MGKSGYGRHASAVAWVCPPAAAGELTDCGSPSAIGVAEFSSVSVRSCPPIGRPVDPSLRAVEGTTALSPSPALWSPGRRGWIPGRGAHFFAVLCNNPRKARV